MKLPCSILSGQFKTCRNYKCRHNVFSNEVVRCGERMPDGGKAPRLQRNSISKIKKYCHCMLLLRITQEEFTLKEIATMYGLTPWGVDKMAQKAMKKLLNNHDTLLRVLRGREV